MNEDRYLDRIMDAADEYAAKVDRARENEIHRLTSHGGDYYPWTADRIQEAIGMANWSKLDAVATERREDSRVDAGLMLLHIVEDYWTDLAVRHAENNINEPEED